MSGSAGFWHDLVFPASSRSAAMRLACFPKSGKVSVLYFFVSMFNEVFLHSGDLSKSCASAFMIVSVWQGRDAAMPIFGC